MSGFKFEFSKIFWEGAHRAPSPDPSPRFFSGFALGLDFALNSQALCAFDSGFALNFRLENLVWPPKINSWIRPCIFVYIAIPGRWSFGQRLGRLVLSRSQSQELGLSRGSECSCQSLYKGCTDRNLGRPSQSEETTQKCGSQVTSARATVRTSSKFYVGSDGI